jgi:hypothetical protein
MVDACRRASVVNEPLAEIDGRVNGQTLPIWYILSKQKINVEQ